MLAILCAACLHPALHPLISAARDGDTREIARLISAGADPNIRGGVNGWTALMHAIHKNRHGSVLALLDHGADPNARGEGGGTALIMAAGYGYTSLVETLLVRGSDPHLETPDGVSALSAAVTGANDIDRFTFGSCQAETVRALLKHTPSLRLKGTLLNKLAKHAGCKETLDLLASPQA